MPSFWSNAQTPQALGNVDRPVNEAIPQVIRPALRGMELTVTSQRIMACKDAPLLDQWIARAVTGQSVKDVFGFE